MSLTPIVSIVDDDQQARESLAALVQSMDLEVQCYASGQEFLDNFSPDQPGCVVLDLRMPQVSGLDVLAALAERHIEVPVIMISGHGDIPAAVAAIKSGAVEFLEKPYRGSVLMDHVRGAIERDAQQRDASTERREMLKRYDTLTPDEKQVLDLTVAGKPDKAIALKLDLSLRTIQLRRASVLRKMDVRSRAELIGLAHKIDRVPAMN
ncbi:MAG: DNA-binding response regulator [Planctomycetota bacterium]|nr:MAG: DNA-binding response regulator [Planctomycetota bacterium]